MKNLNEQMLRIVAVHTGFNMGQEECEDTVNGIKSLIKENYFEKEFVEWLYLQNKKIIVSDKTGIRLKTVDELYNDWVKDK